MQAMMSVRTRGTAFIITHLQKQSAVLPRTAKMWTDKKECFQKSGTWATESNSHRCYSVHFWQQRPKEDNVFDPVGCGHAQDHGMQTVTKSDLRCSQQERGGQAMTVSHKVWDTFSGLMQMMLIARLMNGSAPCRPSSSAAGSWHAQMLAHDCPYTRTGMHNVLQHHFKTCHTETAGLAMCTTAPRIRHYTTTCCSIAPALLSQTKKTSAVQLMISHARYTKPPTLLYSIGGCREKLQMKRVAVLHPVRHYSSGRDTVEKKLLQLMDMWEVEDAVALLRESVQGGVVPHPNVVLNLQQQLANLGEVECLMELHQFLKEHNLTTDARFFHCLQEAYYNSGRISEGVAVLRILYHRTRKFSDVDIYFTLLTVMVLHHFPDRIDLILSFVTDLKDAEVPVVEPQASLWKCYMITERWSEADDLLLSSEELRPLLPQQVARICQGVDKVQFDQVVVLSRLLDLPFIRQRLKVLVAETLITELSSQKHWPKLLKSLKRMMSLNLPFRTNKFSTALDDLQRSLTPQYDEQIQELRDWFDGFRRDDKQ